MISVFLIGLALVLVIAGWLSYRRRALRSLNWAASVTAFPLARKCQRYLRLHGIKTLYLDGIVKWGPNAAEGPVNLRMTNEQFGKKIPIFKFICRYQGVQLRETFFKDILEHRTKNNDWTSLFVVVRTSPPDLVEWHLAETNCVALLQPAELHSLAKALQMIKAGEKPIYEGKSLTLARTLQTGSIGLVRKKPS